MPPHNSESRPQPGSGSANTNRPQLTRWERHGESPVEVARSSLGSIPDLLTQHGLNVRGGTVRCPNLDHVDRHPSASVFTGRDGKERLYCFACGFHGDVLDVAEALGVRVDLRPVPRSKSVTRPLRRSEAELLVVRPQFALEWEVAKILARVPERLARQDVLAAWDWLADRVDISFVLALSNALRGIARLTYGHARHFGPGYAVERLLQEVAS